VQPQLALVHLRRGPLLVLRRVQPLVQVQAQVQVRPHTGQPLGRSSQGRWPGLRLADTALAVVARAHLVLATQPVMSTLRQRLLVEEQARPAVFEENSS
jgi:hypothetical protein